MLATASKPIYAKKTIADPASIPSAPKGKNLEQENGVQCVKLLILADGTL